MAFSIVLHRVDETDAFVEYEYAQPIYAPDPNKPKRRMVIGENTARIRLDKKDGAVARVSGFDWDQENAIFHRAASKILQHYKAGEFPSIAHYAA
jgi:hypothetical protein